MQLTQSIKTLSVLAVILTALVGYQYTKAQNWTSPPANPPSSNVTLNFLDTSSASQVKMGALGTGALSVTGALAVSGGITGNGAVTFNNDMFLVDANPAIRFSDTDSGEKTFWTQVNANNYYVLADRDGDQSYSGDSPWPLQIYTSNAAINDYATFANQVRATQFCSRGGASCITPAEVLTTGAISTYSSKSNPRGVSYSSKPVCSCATGDFLTGCSGPQSGDYDVSAIIGKDACYGEADTPVCTCLKVNWLLGGLCTGRKAVATIAIKLRPVW